LITLTSWLDASRPTNPQLRMSAMPQSSWALRDAAVSRSTVERSIRTAVDDARAHGYSWAFIGSLLDTSGEAARQRYGTKQEA
jgi:hypothetical protein